MDHIYINITKQTTKIRVYTFEISDHLPTFCTTKNTKYFSDAKTELIRNMRHFSQETFVIDNELFSLSQDSSSETNTASVNQDASNLVNMFNSIIDRHAHALPSSSAVTSLDYNRKTNVTLLSPGN